MWLDRVRTLSGEASFLKHPELSRLLAAWQQWASEAEVRTWCDRATKSDEGLLSFLTGFLQYAKSQASGDYAVRRRPRLNPVRLESYLDKVACAGRLRELQRKDEVSADNQEAVSQYLKEFDMLQEGKNPDGFGAFDD